MGDHAAPFDQKDETAVRLLRIAGARRAVPVDRAARVRAAVHAEWRAATKRRVDQSRVLATAAFLAAAATVVFAVGRLVILEQPAAPIPLVALVATIDQLEGLPRRLLDPDSVTDSAIRLGDSIRVGEWIVTDERARVGLRFRDGTSVRLDALSRARLLSAGMIELVAGAVYVDTERESGRFEVRTSLATARDVGTQFEVRLVDEGLRLRVRSGLVELTDGGRRVSGSGGTEVMFSEGGAVSRPFAPHGSDWEWTTRISPVVEIEGLALATFLDRLAREQGWTLRYQDPALAKQASQIVLHGSVKGLRPQDALDVAIATSGLHHRLERGELSVWADSDGR